jgi:hypothetical protein
MALFELTEDALVAVSPTTFAAERVLERDDLQRLLRARPDVIVDDVLIVSEEFGAFADASRRIDLLGLDRSGHLVVVELKRTTDGGHLELQALRYAAMVSAMTFEDLVDHYARYLARVEPDAVDDARARLADHLDDAGGEVVLKREVRLVLVAAGFDREITTTVLWLNDVFGLDIRCVRLIPYKVDNRVILDVQQLIPLPEASDLTIQLRRRETVARAARADGTGPDWTQFIISTPSGTSPPLRKRRAVLALVTALVASGVSPEQIVDVLPNWRFLLLEGELEGDALRAAFILAYPQLTNDPRGLDRWFLESPIHHGGRTWVLSKMWALDTENVLNQLLTLAPVAGFGVQAQRD